MVRYEALMLTVPEITQDESRRLEGDIDKILRTAKAKPISFDRWGKCRLAYPVKKNEYGVYFLSRFELEEAPAELLQELRTLFAVKLNDLVMRHMVSSLAPHASLEYERPLSVEEAPAREASPFAREHKGDSLVAKGDDEGEAEQFRDEEL